MGPAPHNDWVTSLPDGMDPRGAARAARDVWDPRDPRRARMAPRLSWPRRHANNIHCHLNPQRTCAGPTQWNNYHPRPTLDFPLDSRPSLSLLLGPAWTRATQLGHIASRWTRKELCGAAWPAPRKQHDFFELQGTRAGCVPHPSNTGQKVNSLQNGPARDRRGPAF